MIELFVHYQTFFPNITPGVWIKLDKQSCHKYSSYYIQ